EERGPIIGRVRRHVGVDRRLHLLGTGHRRSSSQSCAGTLIVTLETHQRRSPTPTLVKAFTMCGSSYVGGFLGTYAAPRSTRPSRFSASLVRGSSWRRVQPLPATRTRSTPWSRVSECRCVPVPARRRR